MSSQEDGGDLEGRAFLRVLDSLPLFVECFFCMGSKEAGLLHLDDVDSWCH